jgi:ATP-dependent Clp protease adaptor protein ClpS
MEFVVDILIKVFKRSHSEAHEVMLSVHKEGVGKCGVYTREIAETKVATVLRLAKEQSFPLLCTFEPE